MRKNPYNTHIQDQIPLVMYNPSTLSFLTKEPRLTENLIQDITQIREKKYNIQDIVFTTIQPPIMNKNAILNMKEILKIEVAQTPVDQELFEAVLGWNKSHNKEDSQNPVENVTWFDCISFCNKISILLGLEPCYSVHSVSRFSRFPNSSIDNASVFWEPSASGFRLLTKDEWEICARAGTENTFSGCDQVDILDDYAWFERNTNSTKPVGILKPNEWGLHDMSGNVYEWCWDKENPKSTDSLSNRTYRGGAFSCYASYLRCDYFSCENPSMRSHEVGFRICRTNK